MWLLGETGLEYDPVLIDIRDPEAKANSEFLGVSPMGKVPVGILAEDSSINAYVDRCLERPAYKRALAMNEAA